MCLSNTFWFLLLVGLCLLQACRHKQALPKYEYLDVAFKKAYDFKKGSYWIMKDSLNGRIDSFVAVDHINTFIELSNNSATEQSTIDIVRYNISPQDADTLDQFTIYLRNARQFQPIYMQVNNDSFKYFNYAPVVYPFVAGKYVSSTIPRDTITTEYVDLLNAGGHTFLNVAAINLQNTYTRSVLFQFNDVFYLNETEGLVKISMDHASDQLHKRWELLRWKIIRG